MFYFIQINHEITTKVSIDYRVSLCGYVYVCRIYTTGRKERIEVNNTITPSLTNLNQVLEASVEEIVEMLCEREDLKLVCVLLLVDGAVVNHKFECTRFPKRAV